MPLFPFGPPKCVLTVVIKPYEPCFVLTVMGYMTQSLPLKNFQSNQVAQLTHDMMWVLTVGSPPLLSYNKGWSGGVTMEPIRGCALLQLAHLLASCLSLSILGGVWGLTKQPLCCLHQCSPAVAWGFATWVWGDASVLTGASSPAHVWCCPSLMPRAPDLSPRTCRRHCLHCLQSCRGAAAALERALGGALGVFFLCAQQKRPFPLPFCKKNGASIPLLIAVCSPGQVD